MNLQTTSTGRLVQYQLPGQLPDVTIVHSVPLTSFPTFRNVLLYRSREVHGYKRHSASEYFSSG